MTSTKTPEEIEALVSLLADEDPRIYEIVAGHVRELGETAVPVLERWIEDSDARIRMRCRHLLQEIQAGEVDRDLEAIAHASDEDVDLEHGCWVIARTEYPGLPRAAISDPLDRIAADVASRLSGVAEPKDQIQIMNHVIFTEWRFRRDNRNYYDPDNTFLHRVLELRTGVSVSLATLYVLVAKRLGLPIYGVGMPNAVLVRYGDSETDLFLDPAAGGRLLSRRDLAQYLSSAGYYFKDGYISNATARELLLRTLQHLMVSYFGHEHGTRLLKHLEHFRTR
ncbi:MAG: transglutaminase-like domain-containing protein [Candidatus Eisenbacteria bacterium]